MAVTPRTRAILPVSQIGLPADLPAILEVAARHSLRAVEDAAPSLGAMIGGKRLGSLADLTCFSFDACKILTTGEGGVVTTDDGEAAARLRALRAHSASVSTRERHRSIAVVLESYPELGYNYKIIDIQAAIGEVQITRIEAVIAERRRLAARYDALLADEDRLETPFEPVGYRHVYQSYCIRLRSPRSQLEVMRSMSERGVATRRITAIHLQPAYRAAGSPYTLPRSEEADRRTLLLPMFVGLTDQEQEDVVAALRASL